MTHRIVPGLDDERVDHEPLSASVEITGPAEVVQYLKAFGELHRHTRYTAPMRALIVKAIGDPTDAGHCTDHRDCVERTVEAGMEHRSACGAGGACRGPAGGMGCRLSESVSDSLWRDDVGWLSCSCSLRPRPWRRPRLCSGPCPERCEQPEVQSSRSLRSAVSLHACLDARVRASERTA